MNKVVAFLNANPVQYLATVGRDGKAKCRPFMFAGELEGKLWFCTNNQKDVYKDMQADPEIEVSVSSPEYAWIRLHGKAVFENNMAAKEMCIRNPIVKGQYQTAARGITDLADLTPVQPGLYVWQGDITTGIFHFPNQPAAQIAVKTVRDFLAGNTSVKKVIFNVFKDRDNEIYHRLLSRCPHCGRPMAMNLRCDDRFAEDEGWHRAAERYESFLRTRQGQKLLFLELGVGYNTPVIIKYPFWRMTAANPRAVYACLNLGQAAAPREIQKQSICIDGDIGAVLAGLGENTSQSASVEFVRFRRTNSARG